MSTLKKGSRNSSEVKALQLLLNAAIKPSPHLRPDGDFGQRTHDAVMRLQRACRLSPDGVVGAQTWVALGQKPTSRLMVYAK